MDQETIDRVTAQWQQSLIYAGELFPLWQMTAEQLACNVVVTEAFPTAATDGYHLYINPKFSAKLSKPKRNFVAIHEVFHPGLDHLRRTPTDVMAAPTPAETAERFRVLNIAQDAAIHNILIPMIERGELPDVEVCKPEAEPVWMPEHAELSAEQIYFHLREKGLPPEWQPLDIHIFIMVGEVPEGMEGISLPGGEDGEPSPGKVIIIGPDGKPLPKDSPIRKEVEEAIAKMPPGAPMGGGYGIDPDNLGKCARDIDRPPMPTGDAEPWFRELKDFLLNLVKSNYSWKRPNYRYLPITGTIHPGMVGDFLKGVIFVDNSGSIRRDILQDFGDKIETIRELFADHELHIIQIDDRVNRHDIVRPGEPTQWKANAGGANDFQEPFDYLEREGIIPEFALYFTDAEPAGGPPIPKYPPSYPVLWALWPQYSNKYKATPWGVRIELPGSGR